MTEQEREDAEYREVLEELAFRAECEKYRFYEPNGKCNEFLTSVGDGKFFIVFFSAANGVGKTCVASNVVAHLIWGDESDNPWFDHPLFKNYPFPKKGRIVSAPTNIEKNVIPSLKEWLPEGRYRARKGNKKFESIWETDKGHSFEIMTYEQSPKEFEGPTLGWVWFDEPPSEEIFKACISRLRKGGIMFITATPLNGSAWMYDILVARNDVAGSQDELAGKLISHIQADVEAACIEHGVRGHLEHAHIEQMVAMYSDDDKQARVHGKFQHLVGLRYKRFSRHIHVIKPFPINLNDYTVYEALDPHPRNPDAVVWLAVDRKGRKFIIDELYLKCEGGTKELAERILNKASNYRIERRIIDPSAFIEDQHTQQSLAGNLLKLDLNYVAATKARTASDRRIEDGLAYQKITVGDHEEWIKEPEFYVFDHCTRVIWEFEHYRWAEWKGTSSEDHDPKQKTLDKDDHMIECIGRLLYQEPIFIEPPRFNQQDEDASYDPYARS